MNPWVRTDAPVELQIEAWYRGAWHRAMSLRLEAPRQGEESPVTFGYELDYLVEHIDDDGALDERAVSVAYPLSFERWSTPGWPAFLYDIAPMGAAAKALTRLWGDWLPREAGARQSLLLVNGCVAPVGNLRVRQAQPREAASGVARHFSRRDVVERNTDFLEWVTRCGGSIGGATGAGGEAPKLLLVESHQGQMAPDAVLDDREVARHWLVKFPRNQAQEVDRAVLRGEYVWYRALERLGFPMVVGAEWEEQESRPSLWLPRFDRGVAEGALERLGVESLYSLMGVTVPGQALTHDECLRALVALWRRAGQVEAIDGMVADYLIRDLLNLVTGNSDNHGRNLSILKREGRLMLAPIYDLAPMVLDPEGVSRSTRWERRWLDDEGRPNWRRLCEALPEEMGGSAAYQALREAAERLLELPRLARELGLPARVRDHERIRLDALPERLAGMGLV